MCYFGSRPVSRERSTQVMNKVLRSGLIVASVLAASLAGAGIYNRYFDELGGALCPIQHEAIQLQKVKICDWTGVSIKVMTALLVDVRHAADPHMVLIKHKSGVVYQCFWFDVREFDYRIDGVEPATDGCPERPRSLTMIRKVGHD